MKKSDYLNYHIKMPYMIIVCLILYTNYTKFKGRNYK